MISMDTALLTEEIGNARARHESYAADVGRISLVICNHNSDRVRPYQSAYVAACPTQSRSYLHYLIDGYRVGLRFHAEQPVDVIATQDPFLTALIGLALRRRLRVPLIVQDHSSVIENRYWAAESRRNRALQHLARLTLPRADAVRVVNHAEEMACMRLGISGNRICVIPVAPNLERFLAPATASELGHWYDELGIHGVDPDAPLILWVGRPVAVKNLPMLLRAFARVHTELPEVRLVIAGDTSGTHIPEQLASMGLSSSVCLLGSVAHGRLPALYQIATVYAHASNYEGFGLVLAEAAAAGLPIVSTDTDGAREIVVDGATGTLVPVNDHEAMAGALIDLLRDPERAAQIGQRARQHIQQRYDERRLVSAWTGMLRAVANREQPCVS
ncbi:MAG: glycosyltransferase family 4 protein [Anaerolineae bacterium]|nr:glycosyltransferase family 4 protein [Anaerolineae bacterium]